MRSIGSNVATQTVHKPALKRKQRQVIGFACLVNLSSCRAGGAGSPGGRGLHQGCRADCVLLLLFAASIFRSSASTDLDIRYLDDGSRHDIRCISQSTCMG